jgi:hypothetical protein
VDHCAKWCPRVVANSKIIIAFTATAGIEPVTLMVFPRDVFAPFALNAIMRKPPFIITPDRLFMLQQSAAGREALGHSNRCVLGLWPKYVNIGKAMWAADERGQLQLPLAFRIVCVILTLRIQKAVAPKTKRSNT